MNGISDPAQSEPFKDSLPVKKLFVQKLADDSADLKDDRLQNERRRFGKRVPLILVPITFCFGVTANLAWQSHGDAVRKAIANSIPRLDWLAPQAAPRGAPDIFAPAASATPSPDQQQLDTRSVSLEEMRQSVDRIATGIAATQEHMTQSVDRIAASQEQMARTVGQLAAGQEQLTRTASQITLGQEQVTREITKLQAIEQYALSRNSQPLAPKPVRRQSRAQTAR